MADSPVDSPKRRLVTVCQYRSCIRSGSEQVLAAFEKHRAPHLRVSGSECQGQCGSGPTVRVMPDNTWYCQVTPEDVNSIAQEHLEGNMPVARLLHPRMHQTASSYAHLVAQSQANDSQEP
ncbi:MAG: (2Fe-2S) ferredoxin domain-containing protein [Cyanobacteria bacterium]|nr:(2Fe-2S) ferredoxin domain-containing protein [Cyanobacteriota bacterium]MDA0866219.1 (2Fe-2S) ferredoxin domain-containing protein [Cyanobacteriota bacterium]